MLVKYRFFFSTDVVWIIVLVASCISCNKPIERKAGICLSFDDRSIAEWDAMADVLSKYNATVTFFITQFDSLSDEEISLLKLLEERGHEIGSHGAIHVIAEDYIKEHGYKRYMKDEVEHSLKSMQSAGFMPTSFAYPYGSKYWFTDDLILRKFSSTRGVVPINKEKDPSLMDEIYYHFNESYTFSALGIDQNSALSKQMISKMLQRAGENKEVVFLYGHYPIKEGGPSDMYQFDINLLKFILSEANLLGLKFYTFKELVEESRR